MWITYDTIMLDNILRLVSYGMAELNDAGQWRLTL
jgi:hypothetical protein